MLSFCFPTLHSQGVPLGNIPDLHKANRHSKINLDSLDWKMQIWSSLNHHLFPCLLPREGWQSQYVFIGKEITNGGAEISF